MQPAKKVACAGPGPLIRPFHIVNYHAKIMDYRQEFTNNKRKIAIKF